MTGRNPARTEHFPSPTAPTSPTARSGPNTVIGAYEDFLDRARGTDDLSFRLVLELPRRNPTSAQTSTRAELNDLGGFRFTAGHRPTRAESAI